jgi:D-tyrosyl-tRNA(Tyr) deacylase
MIEMEVLPVRAVIQRVSSAAVSIGGGTIASIERGILVLAAFARSDTEETTAWFARKIPTLRIFEDAEGKMNVSLEESGGAILVVSQFTLYGDCMKGKRPGFERSAPPETAGRLYERFLEQLAASTACPVESGRFQEHMQVSLVNDGPVTLIIEKD